MQLNDQNEVTFLLLNSIETESHTNWTDTVNIDKTFFNKVRHRSSTECYAC